MEENVDRYLMTNGRSAWFAITASATIAFRYYVRHAVEAHGVWFFGNREAALGLLFTTRNYGGVINTIVVYLGTVVL